MGTSNNSSDEDTTDNVPHNYKKAMKPGQIKSLKNIAEKPEKAKRDPLLGDPIDKLKKNTKKDKSKSPTDKLIEDDI